MQTVAEYLRYARECREMAARMSNPNDRKALELQAAAWEKIAKAREEVLLAGQKPVP
jgi:hypothetical protein